MIKKNKSGFAEIEFNDRNDVPCSLVEAAQPNTIWFGCNNLNPQEMASGKGWQPVKMPAGYAANTRMLLGQETVKQLLPFLMAFVRTGDLRSGSVDMAVSELAVEQTGRGFDIIRFTDAQGVSCSLQKSSIATEDAVWFGCNNADPHTIENGVKKPIIMPHGYVGSDRMHLNVEQVEEFLGLLIDFAQTGKIEMVESLDLRS